MLTVFMTDRPVTDLESASRSDTARFATWFHGLLNRGVYLPCSQFEAMFISAVHTDEDILSTGAAAEVAFREIAAA
jgi:glutamate-1-semialdehyde 2,1-aminomutase